MARKVVVLPAPLRPISEMRLALAHVEGHAVQHMALAVPGVEVLDLEEGAVSGHAPIPYRRGAHPLIGGNLGIASLGQDLAALQDGDAVAEIGDHREVVLDHHHGAALGHLAHEIDDARQFLPADAGHGLVEQQHLGIERERRRDLERALSPVGELARRRVLEFGEVDVGDELEARSSSTPRLLSESQN